MTGLYFHAFFNKNSYKDNEMYYYLEYEYYNENYYIERFKQFISSSKIMCFNENINALNSLFKRIEINNISNEKDLFDVAQK